MENQIKFIVGRQLPDMTGVYDLEECDMFDDLEGAIGDLLDRSTDVDLDIAGDLQVLRCEADGDGAVLSYEPVLSGLVVVTLIAM